MTTHDQHTEVTHSAEEGETLDYPTQTTDSSAAESDSTSPPGEPSATRSEPSATRTEATVTTEPTESSTERELFADDELAGMRARWDNVQAGFVDDPRECVQKADSLVSDVVERLTTGFTQARSRLEEQWARGEEASTEDLRVALKRYREFFERLLAV
ncbi:MAG: hypothetical protein QOH54_6265 [Mycobacterium sp.]|jgi:hypothetical protein|nr:hypothetical protein [Mycobacterium sp.]MDT5286418.1 hypothetical protein [Mycobacterium sp.]